MGIPGGNSTERCRQTGRSREQTRLLLAAGHRLPDQGFRDFSNKFLLLSLSSVLGPVPCVLFLCQVCSAICLVLILHECRRRAVCCVLYVCCILWRAWRVLCPMSYTTRPVSCASHILLPLVSPLNVCQVPIIAETERRHVLFNNTHSIRCQR